jgi:hypothetical protein
MVETQYFGLITNAVIETKKHPARRRGQHPARRRKVLRLYGLFCKMLLIHRFIKPEKQEAAVFNNRAFYHTGFML